MTNPFIPLSLDGECKQSELTVRLGPKELLSQLTEDCGELIQAAQKMRFSPAPQRSPGTRPCGI